MVHQMGGFDAEKVRAAFAVPARYTPMAVIALGYQLPSGRLPEEMREREQAPRTRRPLTESFLEETWGASVSLA